MAVATAWTITHALPWSSMFKRLLGAPRATTSERDDAGDSRASGPSVEEMRLVEELRAGDESAFTVLVTMYYPAMLRVALSMVLTTSAVAPCPGEKACS